MKKQTLLDIVEKLGATTAQKETYCTNRDYSGKKYCLCTTNEDCEGCAMFTTNLLGQANIVAEAYARMEEENAAMDEAFRSMADAVTVVSSAVESLHSMARELRDSQTNSDKTIIPSENRKLCKEIIAEARKIVRAGGNARFITFPGENKVKK